MWPTEDAAFRLRSGHYVYVSTPPASPSPALSLSGSPAPPPLLYQQIRYRKAALSNSSNMLWHYSFEITNKKYTFWNMNWNKLWILLTLNRPPIFSSKFWGSCASPSLSLRRHAHGPLAKRLMHMAHLSGNTSGVSKSSSDWLNYTGFPGDLCVAFFNVTPVNKHAVTPNPLTKEESCRVYKCDDKRL